MRNNFRFVLHSDFNVVREFVSDEQFEWEKAQSWKGKLRKGRPYLNSWKKTQTRVYSFSYAFMRCSVVDVVRWKAEREGGWFCDIEKNGVALWRCKKKSGEVKFTRETPARRTMRTIIWREAKWAKIMWRRIQAYGGKGINT